MNDVAITEPTVEPNNLKTFFDAAHVLNDEITAWVNIGNDLASRRDRLIELSPKCGIHKSATRDALAKVALSPRVKKDKEPEPAPILDFIATSATGDDDQSAGAGAHG